MPGFPCRLLCACSVMTASCAAPPAGGGGSTPLEASDTAVEASPPGIAEICAPYWPADDCAQGCRDPQQELWAEGYREALAREWGLPRSTIDPYVYFRQIEVSGGARLQVQLTLDWLDVVYYVHGWDPENGEPATSAEAAAGFNPGDVPNLDITANPRSRAEMDEYLADCAAAWDLVVDETTWCQSNVEFDPTHPPVYELGIGYTEFLPDAYPTQLSATVFPFGTQPDVCGTGIWSG